MAVLEDGALFGVEQNLIAGVANIAGRDEGHRKVRNKVTWDGGDVRKLEIAGVGAEHGWGSGVSDLDADGLLGDLGMLMWSSGGA